MVTLLVGLPADWRRLHPDRWQEEMLIDFRMRRKRALKSALLSGYKAALRRHCPPLATEPKSEDPSGTRTEL